MAQESSARVVGLDLPISTKQAIIICDFIKNKSIESAKRELGLVLEKKLAIPLKKFHDSRGHRKGKIGPGFFPQKATKEILKLLNSLESNVRNKGLNYNNMYLKKAIANKASRQPHYGRRRGIRMKRTHIEIETMEKGISKKND